MENLAMRTAVDEIQSVLLSDSPELTTLRFSLGERFGLVDNEVVTCIRRVVKGVNLKLFAPVTKLELILTEGCNLACTYCFEKDMLGYRKMSEEVARAAIELLMEYSASERDVGITLFGGEPTLNFPVLQCAVEHAESRCDQLGKTVRFDMTSNGSLITEGMAEYFAEHKVMVLLSIDGLQESHDRFRKNKQGAGTFEGTMRAVKILKKTQKWLGTKMTVMPENASRLFEDVLGLYRLGINQFLIGHATGIHWPEEALQAFASQFGRLYRWYKEEKRTDLRISDFEEIEAESGSYFGCQAGRNSISVTVDGEISPCSKILAIDNKHLLAKLGDIVYGLSHIRNRFELVNCSQLKMACKEQGIEQDFRGGCFAVNHTDNGALFVPSLQEHKVSFLKRSACSGCSACAH
ncbi:MAG: radical SAM protein [Aphanocapsa lilacina HA4352-LM1]|jgi:uncharacterized protein|nr:radical SAM protein [Aphanocapsa lilacina HA4352-LM1]